MRLEQRWLRRGMVISPSYHWRSRILPHPSHLSKAIATHAYPLLCIGICSLRSQRLHITMRCVAPSLWWLRYVLECSQRPPSVATAARGDVSGVQPPAATQPATGTKILLIPHSPTLHAYPTNLAYTLLSTNTSAAFVHQRL
jgi:hypothetical protein